MQKLVLKVSNSHTFTAPECQVVSSFPMSGIAFLGNDGVPF